MKNKLLLILILAVFSGSVLAQENKQAEAKADAVIPKAESSTTSHQVRIGGNTIRYKAVAGTTILKNDDGGPIANFGYTAYLKEGTEDLSKRPVMFAFNGGPGSSSIWLHMGVLGPVIVTTEDAAFTGPPFKRVPNEFSIIDRTDLVMIDPVGTGYSKPVGDTDGKEFWGVDADIKTVSDFIEQYVTENNRWLSPKYLLGEISESDLIADFNQPAPEQTARQKECEGYYYIGAKRLVEGDRDGALRLFQKSVDTNVRNYYEWNLARAELRRAKERESAEE